MNHSSVLFSRKHALQLLSAERGRWQKAGRRPSPDHPLDPSLLSKWCADLGFELGLKEFDDLQLDQLRAINQHYASGGSRMELLHKMRNPQWYQSQN